ncbi:MAG: restriction endonuclease subunit S [Methylococcaceae bacterium]|nr:restriction endonuclease subunit S [Methylococcaceae bacterium]
MQYQVKRIGDFCRTGSGSTPSRNQIERYYEGGHIPWVKSGELREDLIASTEEHVTDAALHETSIKLVPAGAILIAMYGATVGRLAILGIEATTNQAVCHIVPAPELADARYLYHAVSAQVPAIIAMGVGGAQPNISQAIIKELKVPLPSLPEQRRTTAILDQADALRAKRREALAELDQLTQSIFIEMFGDPVTNPKGWKTSTLGDVIHSASDGPHVSPAYSESGIPFLSARHVRPGEISWHDMKYLTREDAEIQWKKCKPCRGDILYTKGGTTGFAAVVRTDEEFAVWVHIALLKPNHELIDSIWLEAMLNTQFCYRQSQYLTHGIANRDLGLKRMVRILMYHPPLDLQREFAIRINQLLQQKQLHQPALTEFDNFFSSLQHRAFRGEL